LSKSSGLGVVIADREIEEKARNLDLPVNVEKDYVHSWLLKAMPAPSSAACLPVTSAAGRFGSPEKSLTAPIPIQGSPYGNLG